MKIIIKKSAIYSLIFSILFIVIGDLLFVTSIKVMDVNKHDLSKLSYVEAQKLLDASTRRMSKFENLKLLYSTPAILLEKLKYLLFSFIIIFFACFFTAKSSIKGNSLIKSH